MFRHIIVLIISLVLTGTTMSQPWMPAHVETNPSKLNFHEQKALFDTYFENNPAVRGSGYKQFMRYAWFMSPRVSTDGTLDHSAIWNAHRHKIATDQLKTDNPSASWTSLGPFDTPHGLNGGGPAGSGRINCIAFHPSDPNKIYVGAPSGGVWITDDGGLHWRTTTDQLPTLGISDIAINPQDPNIIYMVTGDKDGGNTSPTYSYGILKSIDAGETWDTTGLVHEVASTIRMRRMLIHPDNPDILIAAGGPGVFRSADGGISWTEIKQGNFFDLEFMPGQGNIVYACTGSNIFKSEDAGLSFVELAHDMLPNSGVGRIEMAVTQANSNALFAVMTNSTSGFKGLYKSEDAGVSWMAKSTEDSINIFSYAADGSGDGSGIGWYAIALAIDQQDENIVYSGSVNLWRSNNGGMDWTLSAHWYGGGGAPYVHADEHTLAVNPLNNICYSGNDGGLYKTEDKGINWTDLSDGLSILQVYCMGASASNPNLIMEGSQDNGSYLYHDGAWHSVLGGDGMECAIDPVNPSIMYGSYQSGALHRSDNGGSSWKSIRAAEGGYWITPFQISALNHNVVVAGYESIYLSTNFGDSWTNISGPIAGEGSQFQQVCLAPSDDRYIYVSTGSRLWMTKDRGNNWELISQNLPGITISYIAVAQSEPEKVWVTFSGYSIDEKVFYSEDAGQNWLNYSEGLPNVPVNCITYSNNTHYGLYAGTDIGVYYRNPELAEWEAFDQGLPTVIVNEMEINYRINKIRAATFGRGLWESDLFEIGAWPPALQLTAVAGNAYIDLSWIGVSEQMPDHYAIYRNNVLIATTATNYFHDVVDNGYTYTYTVTAVYPDGESTPTNKVVSRGEEPIEIPYHQNFDTAAHGWLIKDKSSGWRWGVGSDLGLTLLGSSYFIGINSVEASKDSKNAEDYAILPKMNLAGKSNLVLQFDYALRRWAELDHLYLVYRTPEQSDWTTLIELEPSGRMWRWSSYSAELPQEVLTDGIEFAFHYTDNKDIGYGAAIDNFYIGPETSGIESLIQSPKVNLFPLPANDYINIEFTGFKLGHNQIDLLDIQGRIIQSKMALLQSGSGQIQISLQGLPTGNYYLRFQNSTNTLLKILSVE